MPADIPVTERLIVALDYPTPDRARALVEELGDTAAFYKVGLELFMDAGSYELVDWLVDRGKQVFVDLKFFDVPATVARAVSRLNGRGIRFTTVHGNDAMMQAAAEVRRDFQVLAVTVLTSLDQGDLDDLGFYCDVDELVISRTRRAVECGCDGVIASGQDARALRGALGDGFLVVCPGIRPIVNDDDQKRTVNVKQAFDNGADYIVVGRPIRDADDPHQAARRIQSEIAAAVAPAAGT